MSTRLKLLLINAVIVTGAVVIAIIQWPEASAAGCFGGSGHCQGIVGTLLLALLMCGIPIVLWGALAHFILTSVFLKPGEMERHKAQQEIERLPPAASASASKKPNMLD